MNEDNESHLPADLQGIADALVTHRDVADGHLLERTQRRLRRPPRSRLPRPRTVTGVALASALGLNAIGMFGSNIMNLPASLTLASTQSAAIQQYCPTGTSISFRWHYADPLKSTGSSWSGTGSTQCLHTVQIPGSMEGDLKVSAGTTMRFGYDLTIPGNNKSVQVKVTNAHIVFVVHCANGSTPSQSSWTVTMPDQVFTFTGSEWEASGDQSSLLTYQGTASVPAFCGTGQVRFDAGGTFYATTS